jgi:hypothetical protein
VRRWQQGLSLWEDRRVESVYPAQTVVADDSVFEDIVALLRDHRHGRARAIAVGALERMRRPEARDVLLELLVRGPLEVAHEVAQVAPVSLNGVLGFALAGEVGKEEGDLVGGLWR